MPIYEFSCQQCKNKFEELCQQGTKQISCPKCGSKETVRLFSTFGFAVSGNACTTATASSGCGGCSGGHCSTCH
ncbi:MAG TPA: hypothetical protein DDW93_00255 [Firmicutes bacterium]|nr:hypothetical protein [Bacillota bacterium]HBK67701.1 hypothetical protein [Bacillota bacterium]HBT17550.1 hypothetical protein [Bacillota bacterium]